MATLSKNILTRRALLKATLLSASGLALDLSSLARPTLLQPWQKDPLAGGKLLGTVNFVNEPPMPPEVAQGSELDGRLYTNLSALKGPEAITPAEKFYIRTRSSDVLPDSATWQVKLGGLVERPLSLALESLKKTAKPTGAHLMECAGNVRQARFGLLSVGSWAGTPVAEVLDHITPKSAGARVLISGFDNYAHESRTSVPGASWIFTREQLERAGAFLATELNGQPLTRDHGAPVRLVMPGWYGCTCIKWVNEITFVGEGAESTSQMREYAGRTAQKGVPELAKDFLPAVIEQAAMPVRIEKWSAAGKIQYRVVGIAWGGMQPIKVLQIRFNPEEDYVPVDNFHQDRNDPWTLWTHNWSPKAPGTYSIRLSVKEPAVQARRLDSGYYVRSVEITEA
ncbi:MAG TPA: molybdopterin-dependent oxidoreductase [Candidatus Acidoferrum sp.]|nr:molybdopterin-dependent oxidoreductase [Candidatus Acidoferrum sp.]